MPYYEQPIQSSDNFRPSDVIRSRVFPRNFRVNSENDDQVRGQHVPESEEEKSSLEGSSTPPSEDALVGSDSDDRGEMHDVVSNSKTPRPTTFSVQADIIFVFQFQDKINLFLH